MAAVAGVALSELAFRAVKRVVCVTAGAKLFRPHPLYGWTHEPGAAGWTNGCIGGAFEWRAFSRINADGLRDEEHARAPTRGVPRVLILGDSFVEGMQVPLEKTFARRLQAKLAEDGRRVEVVNAGFSGFGTDNELLFFEADGRRYRPARVHRRERRRRELEAADPEENARFLVEQGALGGALVAAPEGVLQERLSAGAGEALERRDPDVRPHCAAQQDGRVTNRRPDPFLTSKH